MSGKVGAIYGKEIVDTLRDGRSVFAIFVFPFLLYPAMILLMGWMHSRSAEEAKVLPVRVGLVGAAQIQGLADSVAARQAVTAVPLPAVPDSLEASGVNAVLSVPEDAAARLARGDSAAVVLYYKEADDRSEAAADRMQPVMEWLRQTLTVAWARGHGARVESSPPLNVDRRDISSKAETGRSVAALVIPYLLVFMIAAGAMHTAVDATTGEKERSTLETILASSASRSELVLGKCAAVLSASLTGAVTGIFGLWFSFAVLANAFPAFSDQSLQFSIGPMTMLWIFLTVLPAAVFLCAVLVAIGCFARSMREGQTYATYVYMAAVFLGIGSLSGQYDIPLQRFFIPILNTALLQREILTDAVVPLHALVAIGTSVVAAAVMLGLAMRLFSNESVLFRT
ncbi:MAG TPA: ABC transporter permease [Candidatus Eisenbacteria bacterium]